MNATLKHGFQIERRGMRLKIVDGRILIGPMTLTAPTHMFFPYEPDNWDIHQKTIEDCFGIRFNDSYTLKAKTLDMDKGLIVAEFTQTSDLPF